MKKAGDKVSVDLTSGVVADLRLEDFERMMDDSVEDTLRFTRNILKHTLEQGLAPANTLAPISKQLIEIAKELEARTGGDIFTDELSDDSEVSEEVFDLGSI
ncbi:hypothetical protein I6E29_00860 [Arcanobacterium haemolyticum]|nr:hypothetical protein [Arcanobacterium haemolyticum]